MKITFTDLSQSVDSEYYPVPAKEILPQWYRDLHPYEGEKRVIIVDGGFTTSTAKKCMPMFDSISSGYIIKTHNDLSISRSNTGEPIFQWPGKELVTFHSNFQAHTNPNVPPEEDVPKFINPWAIKTPLGYSCWFKNLSNNPDTPFEIFEGVVDTDSYNSAVHFPFLLKDSLFSGIIPAGTPIAQVVPFKRDSFSMEIGGKKHLAIAEKHLSRIRSRFFNVYKDSFWAKKDYS